MAIWDRLTALIAGGAVARGAADAVTPVLEPVRQTAWSKNRQRVLGVDTVAALVAQALISHDEADAEVARDGFSTGRLDALTALLQTAPGIGELTRILNRKKIDVTDFNEGLAKHAVDPKWWPWLLELANSKLEPVQLANAIHRGLVTDPGLLAVEPPSREGNVKAYPVYPIDALLESEAFGLDKDRLGVLVGLMGLPMGPHEAAQAVFRGILTMDDFNRAIAEGNTRNEWGEAIFQQTRQIPTARDFFENALRGYHDLAWAQEQAKRHGMSEADSLVIYQNQGRPMNLRQITQALARGGEFQPEPGEITDPYMASIVEGNLKPGYYNLARHLIYQYPSPFVFRQLAEAGTLGGKADVEQWLLEIGWPPKLADLAAAAWTGGGASGDAHVGKAQTQLWNRIHTSYLADEISEQDAANTLPQAGVAATAIADVLSTWDAERALIRKQLTPSQLRKAMGEGVANPATGAPYTFDEVRDELIRRGYSFDDATTFLQT